ncbi:MAG: ComEC/Rec2 family competence protein [Microbacterium sp.]
MPVAAAAWAAAAWATLHEESAATGALVLWIATVAVVVTLGVAARSRRTWVALLAVSLAAGAAVCTHVGAAEPARAQVRALDVSGGRMLTLEVTAVGKIERSATGWRFDATLDGARLGDSLTARSVPAGIPVLVRLSDEAATAETLGHLDLGSCVRLTATAWSAAPGERAVLVVDAAREPEQITAPAGVLAAASALRRGLIALTATLPQPGAGLVAGLAVGDTSAVEEDVDAAMKASSLSHLTAVSGANCALVVAFAFGAAALFRARRGVRVASGAAALAGFVVLVSPEPSVARAAVMAAIAMLGVLLGRSGAGLSVLTSAVVVLLVIDPWLGLSLGFALSAAATGALLVGAGPLADGLARWMPGPLALAISVPLAAQLACGPIIVLISPTLSVYGVAANLLAAPAAPLGTVLGLAACLTAGIPFLGAGLAALAWLPAAWIAGTASAVAALPGSVVAWPGGFAGLAMLGLLGAAVAAAIVPVPARVRAAAVLVLAAATGVGIAVGPVSEIVVRGAMPAEWSIVACDVGQGDAVLVRSGDEVALIDTGPDPALLSRCLDRLGVDRLDLLVLTHFDLDHRGGVDAVIGRVELVLHGPPDGADDERGLARLAAAGAVVTQAMRGMQGDLGGARWRVLWPRADAAPGNDASVVVDIAGGSGGSGENVPTAIFLGDLSAEAQSAMASAGSLRAGYDVVKVSHHGSADQDPALYERLRAAVALFTVGENDYGHPRATTLELLEGTGALVARTDQDGMIALWRDETGLKLWRERAPAVG